MGRIKKSFRDERLRRRDAASPTKATTALEGSHPRRYPKHECPEKGQVYGGICNVTRCNHSQAVWWNKGTFGLYCGFHARGIDEWSDNPICSLVDKKPSIEEMEALRGY